MKKTTEGQEEAPARARTIATSCATGGRCSRGSGTSIDWALDIAAKLRATTTRSSRRSRTCARSSTAGSTAGASRCDMHRRAHDARDPVRAIEIDLGIDSVALLAPLRTMLETPSAARVLRCPGAARDEQPTVVIRRFPRPPQRERARSPTSLR